MTPLQDAFVFFARMGKRIERRWQDSNYDERAFSLIARDELESASPCTALSLDALVTSALSTELPVQADLEASFGQPPLTVYSHELFRIETLFWVDGLPGIHQHAFSGAFHVLHGSSLHTEWTFSPEERIRAGLLLGQLHLDRATLLRIGDTCIIRAGQDLIHSTFHLERPSVTVVIRTLAEADVLPQYSYWPPTVAYDPSSRPATLRRRLQILQMLHRAGMAERLEQSLVDLLNKSDVFTIVHVLVESLSLLSEERQAAVIDSVTERFPMLVERLVPALSELNRRQLVAYIRRKTSDTDLQLFLALALNITDGHTILRLVRERYPDRDPASQIIEWIVQAEQLHPTGLDREGLWIQHIYKVLNGTSSATISAHTGQSGENPYAALERHWFMNALLQKMYRVDQVSTKGIT